MFERYTERARRVVFFARYEASQFGSPTIETPHLLLGLLREDKPLMVRFNAIFGSTEKIRNEIKSRVTTGEKLPTNVDLPLSPECKQILAYASEESERLAHRHIGTEHILIGILREESCLAAKILSEKGVKLGEVRESLVRIEGSHGITLTLTTNELHRALDHYGLSESKEHLAAALLAKGAGDLAKAHAELQLILESLVGGLKKAPIRLWEEILAPILPGFDWHSGLSDLQTGTAPEEDWEFRLHLTLLLANLIMKRLDRARLAETFQ